MLTLFKHTLYLVGKSTTDHNPRYAIHKIHNEPQKKKVYYRKEPRILEQLWKILLKYFYYKIIIL